MIALLEKIESFFTDKLGASLFTKTADLIGGIAPLFSLGFSIYILTLAFVYYKRGLDDAAVDIFKGITGWLLVIAFAFNAGNYAKLATLLYELPDQVSMWLAGNDAQTGSASFFTGISQQLNDLSAHLSAFADQFSWYEFRSWGTIYVAGGVTVLLGWLISLLVWFFYLLAKLQLSLTLMIGPLFVGAMLFPSTRQYGMNWIGQILNFTITISLYAVIFMLLNNFVQEIIESNVETVKSGAIVGAGATAFAAELIFGMVALTVLVILLIMNIPSLVAALTGGAQFSSGVGSAARAAVGAKLITGKGVGAARAGLTRAFGNSIGKK